MEESKNQGKCFQKARYKGTKKHCRCLFPIYFGRISVMSHYFFDFCNFLKFFVFFDNFLNLFVFFQYCGN